MATTKMVTSPAGKPSTVKLEVDFSGLPSHDLASIIGWDQLATSEQNTIKSEVTNLDRALITAGTARLAVGEHLFNIREILEPKHMFNLFLKCCTRFSRASAYRYIELYSAAANLLPAPVVKRAMLRGMDRISPASIEAVGTPPRTTNVLQIDEYLDKVGQHHAEQPAPTHTSEDLKKRVIIMLRGIAAQLPSNARSRLAWLRQVFGMALTEFGITDTQSIDPLPVPDEFKPAQGRPKKQTARRELAA